jgi:type I restriction enzyme S subunit
MELKASIERRYPWTSAKGSEIREAICALCTRMLGSGLLDGDAEKKLCSENPNAFWQQLSEILLADQLIKAGLKPLHQEPGPDFLVDLGKGRLWIEVVTPEPKGLPDDWSNHVSGNVVSLPHEEILLRWTSAIKEKAEKLLGRVDRKTGERIPGYLEKGIVTSSDAYVIAINGRLLRGFGGAIPELHGISQLPYAVEATFAVGPLQITIDRQTLQQVGSGLQHRTYIAKPKGAAVPADTFFDPEFSPISAIWAVDVDELLAIGETRPMVVVHNPLAAVKLDRKILPAQSEYFLTEGDGYYEVQRADGSLADQPAKSDEISIDLPLPGR